MARTRQLRIAAICASAALLAGFTALWADGLPVRVYDVVPGKILRGAWQRPAALRSLIKTRGIRTIVTLTAINRDDPKYVSQSKVVDQTGVAWIIIPMRGSTATLDQLREAARLVADPELQPVFFHCVGGHHRSNLVHAAYRMLHEQRPLQAAWSELASLPWTRPRQPRDQADRHVLDQLDASRVGLLATGKQERIAR